MLRLTHGTLATPWAAAAARAIHSSAAAAASAKNKGSKRKGKRLSNRKAELEAQRAAEAEAARLAMEQLRKLKDTKFLNSLQHPERLFEATQITAQDKAISMAAAAGEGEGGVRRNADSGQYACLVEPSEVRLITDVAPKAASGTDGIFGSELLPGLGHNSLKTQGDIVRRIVALENSNAKGVIQYNIQRAVETFGRAEGDSGSAEVQAAVWTVRINQLEEHLRVFRKDHQNRRAYTKLLHKRAKMLKYLKRESLERYYVCLKQLGLTKDMVEGEILQPKRVE
ncbi:hypothetical protein LPJ63_000435 [Coemansia sp. RSA 2711]|nr:hypothetical protein LPJ63_000435 [Coemansia sp. RSA 2711]KAJ1844125.1 hypothetical protein LPJ70_003088 [Coemansia sp. RSA 2708]KAJ2315048.1 hypothetical protein IWW54_000540 [Coemansia sp. RSA 2705]KAJ2319521.1 hypothetical protein IWW52_001919 [Coemansia sp. RSA 2704]KAJ2325999.1 hypothetical protein IWW51_002506 [Coemansia sp. RSA 2702]KAJ2384804.1 hypothetical protein H4S02_004643 [Coemansia sp. RSA 2611]KAJ2737487.1 hypothetical protein H4R23_001808 [Coemansia sp. Cherry 401B]